MTQTDLGMHLEDRSISVPVLTVRIAGLSLILGRSAQTIQNQMYREPQKIPPWVQGSLPRIWHIDTVNEWLADMSRPQPSTSSSLKSGLEKPRIELKRRPGRPRAKPASEKT